MKAILSALVLVSFFATSAAFAQSAGSVAAPGSPSSSGAPGSAAEPNQMGVPGNSAPNVNKESSGAIITRKKTKKGGKLRNDTSTNGSNLGGGSTVNPNTDPKAAPGFDNTTTPGGNPSSTPH